MDGLIDGMGILQILIGEMNKRDTNPPPYVSNRLMVRIDPFQLNENKATSFSTAYSHSNDKQTITDFIGEITDICIK